MKNKFLAILIVFFIQNTITASTLNVINACYSYTLYFNTISMTSNCSQEIREYNSSGMSGYCLLPPGSSISVSNYSEFLSYYPQLDFYRTINNSTQLVPLALIDNYINLNVIDWAWIIYKTENSLIGHTEGTYLGFSDFYSCHNLSDSWGNYGVTATEAFTSFTITSSEQVQKYFVVGEY